jgi:hypothetical protein
MVAQQGDELVERSGGVPDRQDLGQVLRWVGSTAGTSTCLVYD